MHMPAALFSYAFVICDIGAETVDFATWLLLSCVSFLSVFIGSVKKYLWKISSPICPCCIFTLPSKDVAVGHSGTHCEWHITFSLGRQRKLLISVSSRPVQST